MPGPVVLADLRIGRLHKRELLSNNFFAMFQPMTLAMQGLALQFSEPKLPQAAEVSSADV